MSSPDPKGKSQTPAVKKIKPLKGKTKNQKTYIKKLKNHDHDITFAIGPAGTGKTYIAVRQAIIDLQAERFEKIVITRPNVTTGDDIGYLPGTLREKMQPWMLPITDVFEEVYSTAEVSRMIAAGTIEIAPLAFMRGRTFKDAVIIADEMQNSTPEQMQMLLTRIGHGSMMVVTGDPEQWDRRQVGNISGLRDVLARWERTRDDRAPALPFFLTGIEPGDKEPEAEPPERERIGVVSLTRADVMRHPAIGQVLALYEL